MKILRLRFKNLNALVGEWVIDFSHPAYRGDGIFAITGPTGAGKSTVLDAISLALYGATPRLGRLTQSSNDIMSRHTGECFAELTFAVASGQYRVFWSQRRAHGRADGALQPAKHEIANALSGEVLASQLREVARHVEELSGLDFDRFTRAMLLAQGGFAAFLDAAPDERAPILEQITGTNIYSDISQQVHRLLADEREKLKLLDAKLSGIHVLSAEEEQCKRNALAKWIEKRRHQEKKLEQARQLHQKLEQQQGLQQELQQIEGQQQALQQDLADFAPTQERLVLATKAAALEGVYTPVVKQRELVRKTQASIAENEARKPQRKKACKDAEKYLETCRSALSRARAQQRGAAPRLRAMREYDHRIAVQRGQEETAREHYERKRAQVQERKTQLAHAQQALQAHGKQLEQYQLHDKQRQALTWLEAHLSGLEARVNQWRTDAQQLQKARATWHSQQEKLAHFCQQRREQRAARDNARAEQQAVINEQSQGESEMTALLDGRVLADIRREYRQLMHERSLRQRIASLEAERARLHAGEPCPLCGATEHPYRQEAPALPDALERRIEALDNQVTAIESKEQVLNTLRAKAERVSSRVTEADTALTQINHQVTLMAAASQQQQATIDQLRKQQEQIQAELWALVSKADLDTMLGLDPKACPPTLQDTLQQTHQEWQAQAQAYDRIHEAYKQSCRSVEQLTTALTELQQEGERLQASLNTAQQACQALEAQRHEQFGDLSADTEAERLQAAVDAAQEAVNNATEQFHEHRQAYEGLLLQVQQLADTKTQAQQELQAQEAAFTQARKQQAFSDEAAFLAARMPDDARQQLQQQAAQLQERKTRLHAQHETATNKLNHLHNALQGSKLSLNEAKAQVEAYQRKYDEAVSQSASVEQQLLDHDQNKKRLQTQQQRRDTQQKTVDDWVILHQLIGSSDGKKYRNFAQGLTFERVIHHANQQLQKLTDRYLLVRDVDAPLELNVIDNFQAGEVRSTKNLSGGESFIVSLALALGLSKMSSQRIRVDALFLDEGFGTLDEDVLDTALETLASLQHDGKLIGIISHVPALKERITTRIQVEPQGGGRSRLVGPGCQRVDNDRVHTA